MEYKLPVFEAEDTCEEFNQRKSEFETDTYSKDKTYNLSSNITITRKLFTNKIQKLDEKTGIIMVSLHTDS